MIIKDISIDKFRAFSNVTFPLGKNITAIAGRNATLKTTLLGMIGQPFSISNKDHPLWGSRTIDGYDFRSQFSEKFKISLIHDVIGQHKWTLNFYNNGYCENNSITMESIARKQRGKPDSLRFWNAAGRSAGQGYVQLPVYFLSLSRLYPIGEIGKTTPHDAYLSDEELAYCMENYQEILSISNVSGKPSISIEKGTIKRTIAGFNDDNHDIFTNSAGEGNVARILLAMQSFNRLKREYGNKYKGGILLIDELDATLYPYSQIKLVNYLYRASQEIQVQVIFTTHSSIVLEAVYSLYRNEKRNEAVNNSSKIYNNAIIYLEPIYREHVRKIIAKKIDNHKKLRTCINDMSLLPTSPNSKMNAYCEDRVAINIVKYLLERNIPSIDNYLAFIDINLGWTNYIQLWKKEMPEFRQSLVFLDADVIKKKEYKKLEREIQDAENIVFLPFNAEESLFALLKNTEYFNEFNCNFIDNVSFYIRCLFLRMATLC